MLSRKLFSLVSGAMLLASLAGPAGAQTAPKAQVVGTVDRDKVVTSYPKAQQAAEELKKSEEKIHKLIEESNKQYEDAKTAKKPPAELEGLQKRLQNQINDEVKRVQDRAQTLEAQLEADIDSAIKAEAAARKVDVVIMKQAVLAVPAGLDFTEAVQKRLSSVATTGGSAKTSTK
jgi:Skp family chaperone for outer membrane proteins